MTSRNEPCHGPDRMVSKSQPPDARLRRRKGHPVATWKRESQVSRRPVFADCRLCPFVSHHSSRWARTRCTSCRSRSGGGAGEVSTSTQDLSSHGRATTQRSSGWPWRPTVNQYVNVTLRSGWCSTDILTTSKRNPSAATYERLRACSAGVCSSNREPPTLASGLPPTRRPAGSSASDGRLIDLVGSQEVVGPGRGTGDGAELLHPQALFEVSRVTAAAIEVPAKGWQRPSSGPSCCSNRAAPQCASSPACARTPGWPPRVRAEPRRVYRFRHPR